MFANNGGSSYVRDLYKWNLLNRVAKLHTTSTDNQLFSVYSTLRFEILHDTSLRKLRLQEQTDLRELSGVWTQVLTIPRGEPADNRARRPEFFIYFPTAVISNYFNGKLNVCNCTVRRKKGNGN